MVQGARERLLEGEELLGSSFLAAQALGALGLAQGLRALELGCLLGEEVAEVPQELRCPRRMEGDAVKGTAQGSPLRR